MGGKGKRLAVVVAPALVVVVVALSFVDGFDG